VGRVLPVVVAIALLVNALIDCVQTDAARVRSMNKLAWAAIIVLIPILGPIAWLAVGKVRRRPRPAGPAVQRQLPPDDNPEFLRQLRDLDNKHEKMLNDWEASLRKREEELRRRNEAEARQREDDPRPRGADDDTR
jgi:hypothetical protein